MRPIGRAVGRIGKWTAYVVLGWLVYTHTLSLMLAGRFGTDFAETLWRPAHAVLRGTNPYAVAGSDYPPSAYLPLLPLAALPLLVAEVIWSVVLCLLAAATLWLVGVQDRRCYALWFLTPMIFPTILIGNATIVVIFLSALVWRYRDHSIKAGVALGAAIGVKFFAAPLVVWLIWTRRYKAALVACATAPILIMSAWALIGFEGLTHYRQQLANVAATLGITGPYLQALVQQAGASEATAFKVGIAVGVLLLLAAGFYARRLSDEIGAFALCWLSVLAISPIAWPGYAGGIVIALAAKFPAYGRRWLLLLAFWTGWWHSPFAYKSIGLSIATSAVAVSLTVATLLKDAKQPETIARPEAATAKPAVAI